MTSIDVTVADFFTPAARANPYPIANALRESAALHATPQGLQLVTRYADCAAIMYDPHFGHGYGEGLNTLRPTVDPDEVFGSFLRMDPPDHTRLRRLVVKTFNQKTVLALRPRMQAIVDAFIDRLLADGGIDLVSELSFPLPLTIISELLGVPAADHPQFLIWSAAIARGQDPDELLTDEEIAARATALREFADYFGAYIARRRAAPQGDLVSALAAVEEEGDMLTERELLDICVLLLVAGHETTANLLSGSVLNLLRHPEQAELLRTRPDLLPHAIDEFVRYDPPVQMSLRVTLADHEVAGHLFRRGEAALILHASAHRDPAAFANPDELNVTRFTGQPAATRHIAFGTGIHYCIGANLARLEDEVLVGTLLRRVPSLQLAPKARAGVDYHPHVALRGPRELLVQVGG
jgi:cytochrome P450